MAKTYGQSVFVGEKLLVHGIWNAEPPTNAMLTYDLEMNLPAQEPTCVPRQTGDLAFSAARPHEDLRRQRPDADPGP